MAAPAQILDLALQRAAHDLSQPCVQNTDMVSRVEYVCRNIQNRAGVRLLMACLLAKIHRPEVDIRKPYTEIGDADAYSGRTYDEGYVTPFIIRHSLPCNPTTAFLTPALRNRNATLTPETNLVGRPPGLYQAVLQLLEDVYSGVSTAEDLLAETMRWLLIVRNERQQRIESLLNELQSSHDTVALSAEAIIRLVEQHLQQARASRLPVLVVAAAYQTVAHQLGERALPLQAHNAADQQTQSLGDLEITLLNEDQISTSYEMKSRRVTRDDIDLALRKINQSGKRVDNYIFITTDLIEPDVEQYARSIYSLTGGVEVVVLDCIGFLRHFLHLFHRLRGNFLETYQALVLNEPESAVSQPLKEVFLALRQAAESGVSD